MKLGMLKAMWPLDVCECPENYRSVSSSRVGLSGVSCDRIYLAGGVKRPADRGDARACLRVAMRGPEAGCSGRGLHEQPSAAHPARPHLPILLGAELLQQENRHRDRSSRRRSQTRVDSVAAGSAPSGHRPVPIRRPDGGCGVVRAGRGSTQVRSCRGGSWPVHPQELTAQFQFCVEPLVHRAEQ